jgi:hypothetical protein
VSRDCWPDGPWGDRADPDKDYEDFLRHQTVKVAAGRIIDEARDPWGRSVLTGVVQPGKRPEAVHRWWLVLPALGCGLAGAGLAFTGVAEGWPLGGTWYLAVALVFAGFWLRIADWRLGRKPW